MEQPIIHNTFGFSEMYEWANIPDKKFGKFVQFSNIDEKYHCILPATEPSQVFGVSTINSCLTADNPPEWFLKYAFNEYGDIYFKDEEIAVGNKEYDNILELNYIRTQPQKVYIPIINETFDYSKQYIPRNARNEWVMVNLIGKCIVEDNGECQAGQYCTLYNGDDETKFGTAIPADKNTQYKWRVLNRVSDTTILILYK